MGFYDIAIIVEWIKTRVCRDHSSSTGPALRCYPVPNHVVADYAVNEYVRILTCRHALLADKSA